MRRFGFTIFALILFATASTPLHAHAAETKKKTKSSKVVEKNPVTLYEEAVLKFRKKDCVNAEPMFRKIITDFPYSRFAPLSELRLADCQYKNGDYEVAIKSYQAFMQTRPAHVEVPYAAFKVGQSSYKQIPNKWFMAPPTYERDQSAPRDALRQLRSFTALYPDDDRVEQANEMIKECVTLLAKHEMYVAKFYLRRKAYRGVAGRLEDMLANYPGSKLDAEGLWMLGNARENLKQPDKARDAYQRLLNEHPKSKFAKQANMALQKLSATPVETPEVPEDAEETPPA